MKMLYIHKIRGKTFKIQTIKTVDLKLQTRMWNFLKNVVISAKKSKSIFFKWQFQMAHSNGICWLLLAKTALKIKTLNNDKSIKRLKWHEKKECSCQMISFLFWYFIFKLAALDLCRWVNQNRIAKTFLAPNTCQWKMRTNQSKKLSGTHANMYAIRNQIKVNFIGNGDNRWLTSE